MNILNSAKIKESHSSDVILKKKWNECQNPKKQPLPYIIEYTSDNLCIKEKKAKVFNSMGKDFSRNRTRKWIDRKGRGKKRVRERQDIDCNVSQHSAYVEEFGLR